MRPKGRALPVNEGRNRSVGKGFRKALCADRGALLAGRQGQGSVLARVEVEWQR